VDNAAKKPFVVAWFLAFAVLSTAWCWTAAWSLGPTFDEPFYLCWGMLDWERLNHRALLEVGVMPLPTETQTLPLFLLKTIVGVPMEATPLEWLPVARMTSIVFWWLLLWASYRLAAIYAGPRGGCLAVALVAFEPIFLGHASLATTDLPFAACLLQLLAVFRGRRDRAAWTSRLLWPACWVALTFLAKASALAFVPIALAALEAERLLADGWRPTGPTAWRTLGGSVLDLLVVGLLGIGLTFAVCWDAWDAIRYQILHNAHHRQVTHLLDQTSPTGFPHYFAAALAIKLGLPVLVLVVAMLLLHRRGLRNGPAYAALCLLAATPLFRVQLGVRFVLAIGILAAIGGAVALVRWRDGGGAARRNFAVALAGLLIAVSFTNACVVWPNGICYVNPLFGGTREGFRVLSESNCDWGQGLPELSRWQRTHADAPLSLWYFGRDPAAASPPFRLVRLEEAKDAGEVRAMLAGTYLAASSTALFSANANSAAARYLRSQRPIGSTTQYLLYDFR
jgi:Dolichyl-phosphate-mannose-protein mannosyltransferase